MPRPDPNLQRSPRRLHGALTALATGLLLLPSVAAAQEAAQDSVVIPTPIPASEFAREEESAYALVRRIREHVLPDPRIQEVAAALLAESEQITAMGAEPEAVNPRRYPLRRVVAVRAQWVGVQEDLEEWRNELTTRIAALDADRQELADWRRLVELTDSAVAASGGSALIAVRIDELITQLDAVRDELNGTLDGLLVIQDRVVTEESRVEAQIQVFDSELRRLQAELLAIDAAPLWELTAQGLMTPSRRRGTSLSATLSAMADFARDNRTLLLLQGLLAGLVALGLLAFRRRVSGWDEDPNLRGPSHLLHHPWATAALVGLFLTIPFYEAPPAEVSELAVFLSIPPVLVLLRGLVPPMLRGALYAISGLILVDILASNLDWVPVLGRLLLLVETVLALAGLYWILSRTGPDYREPSRWWDAALVGFRLAMLLLVVSLVANVVGNSSLAVLLTTGVVQSGYLAVLFRAFATVGRGLVALLPRTRLGRTTRAFSRHGDVVVKRLQAPVSFLAAVTWFYFSLRAFSVEEFVSESLRRMLNDPIGVGDFQVTVGGILLFPVAVWLAFKVSQITRFILTEEVLDRLDLPRGVPATISTMTHYTILIIGLVMAAIAAGIDLSRVTLVFGALGVGVGFGLQGLVNNFVSGLILVFERPISVGDTVEVGTLAGRVQRIGMRSTTVLTFDGAEVIVPNGNLIANDLTNWTLTDRRRRVEVQVGVAYGTDPGRVLEILLGVARDHTEVLVYPEPTAVFLGFGDSALNFALRAWTRTFEDHFRVKSELTTLVNTALAEAKIQIPFPQRDLHLRSVAPGLGVQAAVGGPSAPGGASGTAPPLQEEDAAGSREPGHEGPGAPAEEKR